jgi:hypothetical protein
MTPKNIKILPIREGGGVEAAIFAVEETGGAWETGGGGGGGDDREISGGGGVAVVGEGGGGISGEDWYSDWSIDISILYLIKFEYE